jgi:hypothetical protein
MFPEMYLLSALSQTVYYPNEMHQPISDYFHLPVGLWVRLSYRWVDDSKK